MSRKQEETIEQLDRADPSSFDFGEKGVAMKGVDDALTYAIETEQVTWTPEEERRLLWKIDLRLIPLMFTACLLQYSDTASYGVAAIFGLIQDLQLYSLTSAFKLDLHKYQWTASVANLGSIIGMYPFLILAQHLPYGKFTSAVVLYSGLLALLVITCTDFADIMALRFFYGFQVVSTPVFIVLSAMWWKTEEQPFRIGIWLSGQAFGSIVGQGIDFGAVNVKGAYASHPWKWIYVVLGSVTLGFGLVMLWLMPDSPLKAGFLTERERSIAIQRVKKNNTGMQTRKFKWKQALEAFKDPQLYILSIIGFSFAFANGGLGSFAGLLVSSFGFSNEDALKLSMPASGVAISVMLLSGILGYRFHRHRITIAILFLLPAIMGNVILWKSPRSNKAALLAGLYISTSFYGAYVQQVSLMSSNLAGHSKKTTLSAVVFVMANLGGFCGPFAYPGAESTIGYPTGQTTVLSLMCVCVAGLLTLMWHYRRCNAKKDALVAASPELANDENSGFRDLTDVENINFRYSY